MLWVKAECFYARIVFDDISRTGYSCCHISTN